jgi:predicted permease
VIVSHAYGARAGADPAAIGKPLEINGETYTIVGVAPNGFSGLSALLSTDLWLPLGVQGTSVGQFMAGSSGDLSARDQHELMVIGVLRPGITEEQALVESQTIASRLASEYPDTNRDYTIVLGPPARFSISTQPSQESALTGASIVMMAMAGIVLLVACLNLANMFLARGAARRAEIAIRQSLGGGRARILRQLLTEGFLVSLAGGAVGLVLGVWAAHWVVSSVVPILPFGGVALHVALDARVVLAALGYCALATLLFALGPSFELVRSAVADDLKDATPRQTAGGARRGRRLMPRNALVVAQIALSLALVTAAGLFVRSAQRANAYEPEFAVDGRALIEMDASLASLDEARTIDLYRRVLERMRGEAGVLSAALASNVPFSSIAEGDDVGFPGAADDERVDAEHYVVTSGYFETMGLAVLRGRDFTANEAGEIAAESAAAVAIVDEPLARRLREDGDVVGRALEVSTPREEEKERTVEIVGVVPGVRRALFDRLPQGTVYLPFGGNYRPHMIVHLRTEGGEQAATAVLATAAREIRSIDPRLPILSVKTLETHLEQGLERWLVSTGASVFAALGGVAVVLALVGVYGVKSYLVSRRTREIGIRMALGATPRNVLAWMLYDGMPSLMAGVGLGVLLALGIGRLLSSALYGVSGLDLITFVAAPFALAIATLLAAYLPSRRATRLAPSQALREE